MIRSSHHAGAEPREVTSASELYREVALGPGSTEVRAGDFRVLRTTLPARFRIPKHTHLHHNLAYTVTGGSPRPLTGSSSAAARVLNKLGST